MIKLLKKILKLLTSRMFLLIITFLIYLGILATVTIYFSYYSLAVLVILEIISILTALSILHRDFNPAYKISFILLVLLLPLVGVVYYYKFGTDKYSKKVIKTTKRSGEINEELLNNYYQNNDKILSNVDNDDFKKVSTIITNYTSMNVYDDTETILLTPGEELFKKMKEEISKSKKFIFMEYFIIEPGKMWNEILDILKEKASQGLDVRVLYDDFGCLNKIPYDFAKKLRSYGIKVKAFNPIKPRFRGIMNYRDHRKICICDGNVGFLGGINIADEYINEIERFGHWKDTSIMLRGNGVWNLTVLFYELWDDERTVSEVLKYQPNNDYKFKNPGYVQVFGDSSFDKGLTTEYVYMSIINNAKKYVYITSPYLIIDNEMITSLKMAAQSGVDVRLILPHIPDKKIVFWVSQSHYKELMLAGVKIYEYLPGFLHAKTIVSDDYHSMVGTANLDFRSLYLHYEVSAYMYKTKATSQLKEDFDKCLEVSKEMTLENCPKIGIFKGLVLFLIKAFHPML